MVAAIKEAGDSAVATPTQAAVRSINTTQSDGQEYAGVVRSGSSDSITRATESLSLNGGGSSLSSTPNTSLGVPPTAPPAPTLAEVSHRCYNLISSFLSQLEHSCARDYAVPASQRGILRVLVQRALFPRLWHLLLSLGYEEEDLRALAPLPMTPPQQHGAEGHEHEHGHEDHDDDDDDDEQRTPTALPTMAEREKHLDAQLAWLRLVSPLDLGIPPNFCKPPPPAPATPSGLASPRGSFIAPGTPGRAPPNYKPAAPPSLMSPAATRNDVLSPSGSSATARSTSVPYYLKSSYRAVSDFLEELGQLFAPADMLAALLAASKRIYVDAKSYTDVHASRKAGAGGKPPKSEALGADSFFPIFLYALLQSSVPAWLHRLKAMQRFALSEADCMAEPAYYLVTLEAALHFVLSATPDTLNPNSKQQQRKQDTARKSRASSTETSPHDAAAPRIAPAATAPAVTAPAAEVSVQSQPPAPVQSAAVNQDEPAAAAPVRSHPQQPPPVSIPASPAAAPVQQQPVQQELQAQPPPSDAASMQHAPQPVPVSVQPPRDSRAAPTAAPDRSSAREQEAVAHPLFTNSPIYDDVREFDANDL